MKSNRKNVRLFLEMSLFAIVLVACNAAVSSGPAGADQGSIVADPIPVDVTAQKAEAGAGSEEIASAPTVEPTEEAPVAEDVTTQDGQSDSPEVNDAGANREEEEDSPESGEGSTPENTDDAASDGLDEDGIMTIDDRSERQRQIAQEWNTDFNRHTIPYEELLALLPVRDGIIPIDIPTFETLEEASAWLAENEPVIALEIDGNSRAYPLQILTWHEIVNDSVGDIPVVVTFCPLCNSALVFDRRLDGETYDFGTSGWLRHSDLVMWDRNTESLWQQFTGEGIVGELAGKQLDFLPSSIISFADFSEAYPDGIVLSRNTGFGRPYGQNPYPGYDRIGEDPFAFIGVPDRRLAAMERVVTVSLDGVDLAYPLLELLDAGVINDAQEGQDLVVFHVGGTASALDNAVIFRSEDVGATGVFDPNLDGQKLTFIKDGDVIMDEQSGSTWNIVGQAIDGPLAGEQLAPIVHGDHFWFSWAAFRPDTIIYGS
ncbi:MAG: DUF3179 domain-containing (seleno)protein [Candidatus Promineifilaceae bacterium]